VDVAHHVTQRGNARQFIFDPNADRMIYMDLLGSICNSMSSL